MMSQAAAAPDHGAFHRIERIRDVDDARRRRNVTASQAKRVALSVGPLVVELDDREVRRQEWHRPKNVRAE